MGLRNRKSINKAVLLWVVAALLLLIMATPALSVIFAAPGSVNSKAIVNGAVKARKIAGGAVNSAKIADGAVNSAKIADGGIAGVDIANGAIDSAKIADGSITNSDIAVGAAIAASKINRTGFDADLLDGFEASEFIRNTGAQSFTGGLTADSFNYTTTKTGYLSIPANSFQPVFSTDAYDFFNWDLAATGGTGTFFAPVNLPDGVTITEFRYTFFDNVAGASFAELNRRSDTGVRQPMAYLESSVNSSSYQTLAGAVDANYATVDNANYIYFIRLYLDITAGTEMRANRIRITYTSTSPGL